VGNIYKQLIPKPAVGHDSKAVYSNSLHSLFFVRSFSISSHFPSFSCGYFPEGFCTKILHAYIVTAELHIQLITTYMI